MPWARFFNARLFKVHVCLNLCLRVSCKPAVRLLKAGTHKDVTRLHNILHKAKQSEVKCTHGHVSTFTIGYYYACVCAVSLRVGGIGDRCSNAVSDDVDGDHTVRFFISLHKMSHVVSQVVDFSLVAFHWDLRSICP